MTHAERLRDMAKLLEYSCDLQLSMLAGADALDRLAEARRERDEAVLELTELLREQNKCLVALEDLKREVKNLVALRNEAVQQRDEAEALLKHVYEYCKCEGSGKFQATPDALHYLAGVTDVLLHERGLLENGQ